MKLKDIIEDRNLIKEQRLFRAKILLRVIRGIPEERIDLDKWRYEPRKNKNHCGTIACIGGWAQIYFEKDMKRVGVDIVGEYLGGKLFREGTKMRSLFAPTNPSDHGKSSKEKAINRIKSFIQALEEDRAGQHDLSEFR